MNRRGTIPGAAAAVGLAFLCMVSDASAQSWALEQNDPNPFCPTEQGTAIRFDVAQTAPVLIQVRDSGETTVIRTLVDELLAPGAHVVLWDGRDDQGVVVPESDYPYRMTAGDFALLFEDTKVATVACPITVHTRTWGFVKARYRE